MYISDAVKGQLRAYRGKSLEIDAKQVHQPINPGDGLITKFEVVGPSTEATRSARTPPVRGLDLRSTVRRDSGRWRAEVEIRNNSTVPILIEAGALGFAVIGREKPPFICPSDGTSCAVITRISANSSDGANSIGSRSWGWSFDHRLPERFTLQPGEERAMAVFLDLRTGSYEFIAGYGGGVHAGPCAASNAVPFNVNSQ